MTSSAPFVLARAPRTDDELWYVIKAMWGVELPRISVCPGHISPFQAVADAFFAREPGFAVWYASRGSGKSLALAVLGLTKAFVMDSDVTILGGSMTQSLNVREHMRKLMASPRAPRYAVAKDTATLIGLKTGKTIRPLPASQTTVRGPHPPLQLLDEVDEMDEAIYNASLGQAMEQDNIHGHRLAEYIVASSTWQNPIGTFTNVIEKARAEGQPVMTWCWRELLEPHGWMSQRFIDQKRRTVSAQMWHTEYELNEPSGTSRAFDLDKIEQYFEPYPDPVEEFHELDDDTWEWESPNPLATYASGADWAKEADKTVLSVIRTDVYPRRLVYLRRMNRRPYPVMLKAWEVTRRRYNDAVGRHDGTGLGNVVHDFLEQAGSEAAKEVMVGRERSQMFSNYVVDFENGGYRLPRNCAPFYKAHRGATVADVFAPRKWDDHTPDDLVSIALAHKAAGRSPDIVSAISVGRSPEPRQVDKDFHVVPESGGFSRMEGDIMVVDERYDDIPTFDFMA